MAVFAMTSTFVSLSGTDLSQYIQSAELSVDAADLDSTDFASGGWTESTSGLRSGQLAITFNDDMAVGTIDSILWAHFIGAVAVTFEFRPTSAAVGTSNPKWTGSLRVNADSVGGAVGSLAQKTLTFPTTGTVTRATA